MYSGMIGNFKMAKGCQIILLCVFLLMPFPLSAYEGDRWGSPCPKYITGSLDCKNYCSSPFQDLCYNYKYHDPNIPLICYLPGGRHVPDVSDCDPPELDWRRIGEWVEGSFVGWECWYSRVSTTATVIPSSSCCSYVCAQWGETPGHCIETVCADWLDKLCCTSTYQLYSAQYYPPPQPQCQDKDGDGHYAISASCPKGDDCNDNDPTIYPGAPEICDGKDNNCDRVIDEGCYEDHRAEAFRKMDERWNTLRYEDRVKIVKNTDTLSRFTGRYATLRGDRVKSMIDRIKATNPNYANINTRLVEALIFVESSNNFLALSPKGALGLGQIMRGTAVGTTVDATTAFTNLQSNLDLSSFIYNNLALDNRTMPERNVNMTLNYIVWLSERPYIGSDIDKMLAAYNWGPGRLAEFLRELRKHGKEDEWFKELSVEHPVRKYIEEIKKRAGIR